MQLHLFVQCRHAMALTAAAVLQLGKVQWNLSFSGCYTDCTISPPFTRGFPLRVGRLAITFPQEEDEGEYMKRRWTTRSSSSLPLGHMFLPPLENIPLIVSVIKTILLLLVLIS